MSKRFFAAICITLFLILSSSINAGSNSTVSRIFSLTGNDFSSSKPLNYVPGELLVKYKPQFSLSSINSLHSELNVTEIKRFSEINVHHIKLPSGTNVEDALKAFKDNPAVEYAEPNYIRQISATTPNDTYFTTNLWGMHNTGQTVNGTAGTAGADIKATDAWDIATGNSAIIVGLIDSGVAYDHPDLAANISATRHDFVNNDGNPMDSNDHGTHVAGTIAAVGNNSYGVAGVTWSTKIMPLRAGDATGFLTTANIISAIDYARTNGAKIINASFGSGSPSSSESAAIAAARDAGILFVAAAGNGGTDGIGDDNDLTPEYPASYNLDNIISVAATDQNDHLSSFSNYGLTSVHVGAPGKNIYSTRPARQIVFSENFDSGLTWTHGGTADTWGISSVHLSGSSSLAVNPVGNYSNSANAWVRSPAIDLSSSLGTVLTFNFTGKSQSTDRLHVEVSTDNTTWYDFGYLSGDWSTKWYPILVDFGGYNNSSATFYVRFLFVSDASTQDIGFFIDDVTITAASSTYTDATTYYQFLSGTSMATPHVTGLAALIWGYLPSLTYSQVKDIIMRSVDLKSSLTGKTVSGGRINAYKALNYCIAPAAPGSLTATAASFNQINLSWASSAYVTGYTLQRKNGASGTYATIATPNANITSYNDIGLGASSTYYYRLLASNYGGNSGYSIEVSATTPAAPAGGGGGGGCFIATAAFGSPLERHVQILRDFRDRILLNSAAGKALVNFYYEVSPPIAQTIARNEGLRLMTRASLMPVIGVAYLILQMGILMTVLLFAVILFMVIFTIRILRKRITKAAA
jgi:subtilisin family serine protease